MSNEDSALADRADLLIQSITDYAIYMLDLEGRVLTWNPGAETIKGYSAEEIIGEHFSRFYTEEDRAAGFPATVLESSLRDGRFEAEGWRIRKDGTRFWANVIVDPVWDEQGRHVGYAKITRDLTDRREAEEALKRSEEHFRLLVQGVKDYAIYMLDPQGRVTSWNEGARRIKGYAADEIIGQNFARFYQPEDCERGAPLLALATAAKEGRFHAEAWRVRKDGTRFWADVIIDPIRDDQGRLLGFTKITRDLTERKQAQEALERSQEHFFQSQKLESIGKLTGGVAHDFNNILAAITGSLDIAQRRLAQSEDASQFIENALNAANRGATLTQRMLAFARKQDLKLESVNLTACISDMAELLERTIGPGITISTSFPLRLAPIVADRGQIELALMNLVVNARDAMPTGGSITIQSEAIQGGEEELSNYVRLTVEDEGEGMPPEILAQAMEPFFTTKGVGKGTGLGLSMVQGMVEQCGGRFSISSEVGKGTKAVITLPAASLSEESAADEVSVSRPKTNTSLTIVAVDDDPIILLNTVTILEEMGHTVLEAHSAAMALKLLDAHAVDLLISDYAMPGMTGGELIVEARKLNSQLKVIIISGYADLPEGERLNVPRLAKPFREKDLVSMIDEVTR